VKRVRLLLTATLLAGVALGAPSSVLAQGFATESTPRFDVRIDIEADGSIVVSETIVQDFGDVPRHGIFRTIPNRVQYDDEFDRVYPIDLVSVQTSQGTPDDVQTSEEGGHFVIRIGDPDVTITGRHTYLITYFVGGALNDFPTHQELYWNAIGDDWEQPIGEMRVRVAGPGPIERVACFQGPFGSTLECDRARIKNGVATFVQERLDAFTGMSIVTALPPESVTNALPILEPRWSLQRAFSVTPLTVVGMVALLAAIVAAFSRFAWRRGRDVRFSGSQVDQVMGGPPGAPTQAVPLFEDGNAPVEFAPPDGLRPGQVGTLLDEEANTLDVSATIVDLAVRKFLVIEELEKKWFLGKPDWRLTRLPAETDGMLPYERSLLDGLFEDGDEVELSDLRKKFVTRLKSVKDALYDDVVRRKWFLWRPDKVRQTWGGIGVVALLAGIGVTVLLAWRTTLALLGIPFVVGGLLLLLGAKYMPARTAMGTALTRRVTGFRRVVETADEHLAKWAEQENVFTKYLPYAVVFGVTDKWARTFESLGAAQPGDTNWYVSTRPFAYAAFADSLDSFAVTTSGVISSTPSGSGGSGFGGGGFSGGGGGGGGGGSW
jgi:uncharacterized membrane protein YgcG